MNNLKRVYFKDIKEGVFYVYNNGLEVKEGTEYYYELIGECTYKGKNAIGIKDITILKGSIKLDDNFTINDSSFETNKRFYEVDIDKNPEYFL